MPLSAKPGRCSENLADMAATLAANPNALSCAAPSSAAVGTLVFISTGMPKASLADLFLEADNQTDVQFVLRGWDDLARVGSRIMEAKGKARVNVIVHPELFRGYGIEQVPVFLVKKDGKWFRVTGNVGLAKAREMAGTLKTPKEPVGEVYVVSEPDLLDEIEKRAARYDWDGAVKKARDRFTERWVSLVSLPPAVGSGETRLVNPTVVATQDVTLPDGSVVVAAGAEVNPLDYVGLDRPIVVFDPRRRCEMAFARAFSSDAYFLATALSMATLEQFGREVFIAPPEAVERFGLWATPAVITLENRMFRVETKPCID